MRPPSGAFAFLPARFPACFVVRALGFEVSLPVLERAGLIARGRSAQWRPCRLEASALKDANEWMGQYRKFWEQEFERLDAGSREPQATEKKRGPTKSK